ncbi:hypothetical protein EJ05DRAFT_252328 [Pseudovirgaria hyperparasitica]|uniref:Uncharacterized protein n=1 Tax=Pseudovirgaria hyperparasitica TaxID=470096 RepID=A0A6A6WEX2_9PEZI|nr:uncharacterized protein EJ05DRAFT_252328 [Pseudovirgaria hyperparasitica]KAF2761085.1 hypothetical protein EJ05DRAFT_252328 [Pseudovirgaria hyperparasitica]
MVVVHTQSAIHRSCVIHFDHFLLRITMVITGNSSESVATFGSWTRPQLLFLLASLIPFDITSAYVSWFIGITNGLSGFWGLKSWFFARIRNRFTKEKRSYFGTILIPEAESHTFKHAFARLGFGVLLIDLSLSICTLDSPSFRPIASRRNSTHTHTHTQHH